MNFVKEIIIWLGKVVEESPGEPSTMRVVVLIGMTAISLTWAAASLYHHTLLEIPGSVLAYSGSLLTAKAVQKSVEPK